MKIETTLSFILGILATVLVGGLLKLNFPSQEGALLTLGFFLLLAVTVVGLIKLGIKDIDYEANHRFDYLDEEEEDGPTESKTIEL